MIQTDQPQPPNGVVVRRCASPEERAEKVENELSYSGGFGRDGEPDVDENRRIIAQAIREAMMEEREACANLIECKDSDDPRYTIGQSLARKLRGGPPP